jgi:phosphoserine phosphatase RsbU/P
VSATPLSIRARTKAAKWFAHLGRSERLLLLLLVLYLLASLIPGGTSYRPLVMIVLIPVALFVIVKWTRRQMKKALWRLRNRLIVCYLFIGVVPLLLIMILFGLGAWVVLGQVSIHLVTTRLNQDVEGLTGPVWGLVTTPASEVESRLQWMQPYLESRYPGVQIVVRRGQQQWRLPDNGTVQSPPERWGTRQGLVSIHNRLHMWSHVMHEGTEATIVVPLGAERLARILPDLGEVTLGIRDDVPRQGGTTVRLNSGDEERTWRIEEESEPQTRRVPPPVNRMDLLVIGTTFMPVAIWEQPERMDDWLLAIFTRPSAVLRTLYSQRVEIGETWRVFFVVIGVLFLVVELVSLIIGISITRKMTGAVNKLSEGTERVMQGDFSHRISVEGRDQLAQLGSSFNRMTENLQRLLVVEKEQQRLQSELEIAREVQSQLFPKVIPNLPGLQLAARCDPARMVSGDYYDYIRLQETRLAIALGDVAGKGISAALLMAAVQSTMRTQLTAGLEWHKPASGNGDAVDSLSAAIIVSRLNVQLYATTSPEKFATFCFAVYDDETGSLTYTNAGHLPPVLLRRGHAHRLDVNGMVVGAFPFSQYEQSQVVMEHGDLLLFFTDGVTEPENEYGEMFGEERLIQLLTRNAERDSNEIVASIIEAVHQWTGSPELQDDMTVLLARKL